MHQGPEPLCVGPFLSIFGVLEGNLYDRNNDISLSDILKSTCEEPVLLMLSAVVAL